MKKNIFLLIFLLFIGFGINILCNQYEESQIPKESLTEIISLIPDNSKLAEQKLKHFKKDPVAKMYLAYIYMTNKEKINHKHRIINNLTNDAINIFKNSKDYDNFNFQYGGGDYGSGSYPNDFKNVNDLFQIMRFTLPDTPAWLVVENPDLAFKSLLPPYFGSNRDNFLPTLKYDNKYKRIDELKEINVLLNYTRKNLTDYSKLKNASYNEVYGSIVYSWALKYQNEINRASLDPRHYINIAPPQLRGSLEESPTYKWETVWNKVKKNQEFFTLYKNAQKSLENYYLNKFKLNRNSADIASKNALNYILIWHFYNNEFGACT